MPALLIVPSARIRRFSAMCRRLGTDVLLNGYGTGGPPAVVGGDPPDGVPFRAITKPVAENLTGTKELSVQTLGVLIASTDSRVFELPPIYFAPYTTLAPPTEKDLITWHNLLYFLTHVTYDDLGPDTVAIRCFGFRMIQDLPPV